MKINLGDLRSRARTRADMVGETFVSNTQMNEFLNEAIEDLHEMLANSSGDHYRIQETYLATSGSTDTYPLPGDVLKILAVDINPTSSTGSWDSCVEMKRYSIKDRNRNNNEYISDYANSRYSSIRFRMHGADQIRFAPLPQGTYGIRITYYPVHTKMTNDADEYDFHNGWERYVILSAAIKAKLKEESDVSEERKELEMLRQNILNSLQDRNDERPLSALDFVDNVDNFMFRDLWDI